MSPSRAAIAAGLRRGAIEFRNGLQTPTDLGYYIVSNLIFLTVIIVNRDNEVDALGIPFGAFLLPGALAMILVFGATYGLASLVSTEREDGTLLRAKSLPQGVTGYVAGQTARTTLELAFSAGIVIVASTILVPGVWDNGPRAVFGVLGMLALGLLATLPLGLAIGSVFKNPRSLGGWGFIIVAGLIAISGVLFPIAVLPEWVQVVAQLLPLYWLGLGMRSAILPDWAAVAEIGESWRTLETVGILGVWAVAGLLLAPVLLRRMARRESGSAMDARRETVLRRVG
jgi:ABC-2 type transport system permease protein